MTDMIERVATAIAGVQLFSRFNDWTSDRVEGASIEICRYGKDDEPEIVVIKRFSGTKKEDDALYEVVAEQRARAAIEAMRDPTEAMKLAGAFCEPFEMPPGEKYTPGQIIAHTCYEAMIDAALERNADG